MARFSALQILSLAPAILTFYAFVCIKSVFLYVYNNTTFTDKVKIGSAAILAVLVYFQVLAIPAAMLTIVSTAITSYYSAFALACIPRVLSWINNNVDTIYKFLIVMILYVAAFEYIPQMTQGLTIPYVAKCGFVYVASNMVPSKLVVRLLHLDLSAEVAVPKLFPMASFAISTASVYLLSSPISAIFA